MTAVRVLLAEDDLNNQRMIRVVLEDEGYDVTAVECGAAALAAVIKGTFDVVLMDVSMPGMNGVEATRAIRALGGAKAGIPIVALTANAMKGDREHYLSLGVSDYLSKPMHIADLIDVLERQRRPEAA